MPSCLASCCYRIYGILLLLALVDDAYSTATAKFLVLWWFDMYELCRGTMERKSWDHCIVDLVVFDVFRCEWRCVLGSCHSFYVVEVIDIGLRQIPVPW